MLRYIISLITAVVALGVTANTVTLGTASGHPGDEVTVSLAMSGPEAVTALEAVIPLGDYLQYVDGSVALAPTRSSGHQVSAGVKDGALRIYAYSLGLQAFKGTSGTLLTFKLRLGPTSGTQQLEASVVLSDASGSRVNASAETGSVTILSPMLEILTSEIDFGHVPIRSTYEATLKLKNTGNEPLHIARISADDAELAITPSTKTIATGSSANFTVKYSPVKRDGFAAAISIESDAVNAKKYGKWQSAEVVADPYSVNELYVNQVSGKSDTEVEVSLRMSNMEPIVAAEVYFALPEALVYVDGSARVTSRGVDHQALASLADGKLRLLAYSPSNKPFKGDDGDYITFRLRLNGRSGWYWLQPERVILSNAATENMVSATYGENVIIQSPRIEASNELDFGDRSFTSDVKAVYSLYNAGEAPLVIDKVTFLSEGFAAETSLPLTISPYENGKIIISHTPTHCGSFSTAMNVYSNDPECRMLQVQVKGNVYSPNELAVSGTYDAGHNYLLSVALDNHADVAALQFDVEASPSSAVTGTPEVTASDRLSNHSIGVYDMGEGKWRVIVYSMDNDAVAGKEGELMKIMFNHADFRNIIFSITNSVISMTDGSSAQSPELTANRSVSFVVPSSMSLSHNALSIEIGETAQISAIISPGDATDGTVTWTSSDPEVATISADGYINALSLGSATLTATTWNGIIATCAVTVTLAGVGSVVADGLEYSLEGTDLILGGDAEFTLWTNGGTLVYHGKGTRICLLPNMIYILRTGSHVHKIIVK